jgi:mannose-6-phosphate isomerase
MLHALGKGLLIYEVQQPSDVTYRLYDYDRGRQMDVEKAIDNIIIPNKSLKINNTGRLMTPHFKMKYINNTKQHKYIFKDAN